MGEQGHGGRAIARALKALGVDHIFALTGGHIFGILDGCHQEGIAIVDVRHEQNAGFAAEGWARLARSLGVAAVTAGPGVTNAISPLAQSKFNHASVLLLAGRAPEHRWGKGSLQEIDHVPFVGPLAPARTVREVGAIASAVLEAGCSALTPPRGPRFLDFPTDVMFGFVDLDIDPPRQLRLDVPTQLPTDEIDQIARLIGSAERPIVIAGSNVWLDQAEDDLLSLVETVGVPVYMNGQARGCVPADHELAFARSRSKAMRQADLVVVAGAPLDFRLGFGESFAQDAKLVHIDSHEELIARHVQLAGSVGAPLDRVLPAIVEAIDATPDTKAWVHALRAEEHKRAATAQADLSSSAIPIHPMRIYGELAPLLERNAVVICDAGDFASYAGREIAVYEPGTWLDPGPFGCLGVGPGYAIAARLAHRDRQVVVLFGDGAIGFSGAELESLVRHKLPAVCIVGNNGIWGLEKHPMRALFGYDVAADLQPGLRYDRMMEAFGGKGEIVTDPDDLAGALRRAFEAGEPYLVNVLTDPDVVYPRSANLL